MHLKRLQIWFILFILLISSSTSYADEFCTDGTRTYRLGFTPFPYDISAEAVQFSYEVIAEDTDLIAHHFDDGVPWVEALAGESYAPELMFDWHTRRNNTPPDHAVYLALTPINFERDGLAAYRGSEASMPLPDDWGNYAFNHPNVKQAYLNHVINAVEFFDPDFLAYGIEVNLMLQNSPEKWAAYLELQRFVHGELSRRYIDLPIMVSVAGLYLLDGYVGESDVAAQQAAFPDIMRYSDGYAISMYPYLTNYTTGELPETMFDDLFSLSPKPTAIVETGYPAQSFSVFDGAITFEGTAEKQTAYFTALLQAAQKHDLLFVVNFVSRDYDVLWEKIGGGDLNSLWRDTGFYDEDGNSRLVLDIWQQALDCGYIGD